MKNKFIFTMALMALFTFSIYGTCFASTAEEGKPYYASFTGTVKEITKDTNGNTRISLGDTEITANFILDDYTYIVSESEIKIGDKVTGYYPANMPMIMIYPPQFTPEVVILESERTETIKVDLFDEDLISSDGTLRLDEETVKNIKYQNGLGFTGSLKNLRLVVTYTASTRSLPAIPLTPEIVVLITKHNDEPQIEPPATSVMNVIANGTTLSDINAYNNDEGVIMLPLRKISEALGFKVVWEQEMQTIFLDGIISLKPGIDNYTYFKTAPITLGTAPEVINEVTYVPVTFFNKVANLKLEINETNIIINK